ncbi:acyl-CoA N-acyltransferase [Diplogelasinospora grovesii]|uniref:Acyl-CoA N-acyltransferase n=1 Tax=Diplogelasinospora grovesii TaxID=303347 RepID=A0AAN6S2J0_9PEZI|nr:acyl-CoA N-acyltransferase [Diplogelasinospora grovesii]
MVASLRLRAGTATDFAEMARVGCEAFKGNLINNALFPEHLRQDSSEEDERQWRIAVLEKGSQTAGRHYVLVIQDGEGSGEEEEEEIVGWAEWQAPKDAGGTELATTTTVPESHLPLAREPASFDKDALEVFRQQTKLLSGQVLGSGSEDKFWCLYTIAVHPNHQRRGVGTMLVQWGVEMARKSQSAGIFLFASPAGKNLYSGLGFRDLGQAEILGDVQCAMLWEPPPSAES